MTKRIFNKNIFLWAAILISCLFVSGCENDERMIDAWTGKRQLVEEAKDVTSYFSQAGRLKATLKAPLMLRYQSDTAIVEFPNTLHVDFFDSSSKRESWLDARYGKYIESYNKVLLRDSVRVINVKGDTLTTPELWWDQNQGKFFTDSVVRIATKDRRIIGGKGMEAAQDISWYIIKRPTGALLVPENMQIQ
ncbi:MAG TPA: LPS export ABC transporter periplasmic protein LptC [Chitinophagaceae bacterium]